MFIQLIRSGLAISAGCILATNLLLTYVGEDRPGIVQELSALVSAHEGNWLESKMSRQSINVIDLETSVRAAPMSGDKMFFADAQVLVPSDVDLADLHDRLDSVANDLGIDILLELSE